MSVSRITRVIVTPVAFKDPALLNVMGVHEPFALRAIIQVETDSGSHGLGETYADADQLARLRACASAVVGANVHDLNGIRRIIESTLRSERVAVTQDTRGFMNRTRAIDLAFSPIEVACLDIQGKEHGLRVVDLLGGAVRDAVPFSAYLFYKWEAHPGLSPDSWGEALDADQIVAQAHRMVDEYGFTAIKLKGGVFEPDVELEALQALKESFPEHRLRFDPNGAWTVDTSIRMANAMEGLVEYLEDPTLTIEGMAAVGRASAVPLATNMCVTQLSHVKPAVKQDAVQIVLSDHHFWGGIRRSQLLAGICDTFDLGLSMHSNSHLGISLAAMTHLGSATPNLTYASDTHYPWKTEDVVKPGKLSFINGSVVVPPGAGLGIELDEDSLAALHEQYLTCGITGRDDTGYMRTIDESFAPSLGRW